MRHNKLRNEEVGLTCFGVERADGSLVCLHCSSGAADRLGFHGHEVRPDQQRAMVSPRDFFRYWQFW